ncbi:MAG: polyphenol oxidase family protein [Candidatus Ancaeobacter aquaticus]|nr:polyphenol oxidase family protein [Candidatus Ancaeobacter aquaticus]
MTVMISHKEAYGVPYIEYDELTPYAGIKCITTLRSILQREEVAKIASRIISGSPKKVFTVSQVHGDRYVLVKDHYMAGQHKERECADAIITTAKRFPIAMYTADCLPILLFDEACTVCALIHAGKMGTQKEITYKVAKKIKEMGQNIVHAIIGPSIGPCCYEIDLWSNNETQLQKAGIAKIHNVGICTSCNTDTFFSYRKEKGTQGRLVTVAQLE